MIKHDSDDTVLNLQEDYNETQIPEVIDEPQQESIGLIPVKTKIKEIAAGE